MKVRNQHGAALRHLRILFEVGAVADLTDQALLERFTASDDRSSESAFAVLVERHGPMVYRICRAVLADNHAAEDAFQATFLVLARKASTLRVRESLAPWLSGTAYRTASSARMARARRQVLEERSAMAAARTASPDVDDETVGILHEEIERLPERYRRAVVLCYLEGLTHEQAARRLSCPVGTVRSRLATARERLRERITRRGLAPAAALAALVAADPARAALPAGLARATASTALRHATAGATPGLSSTLATFVEKGAWTMQVMKLKWVAPALAAVALAATGLGVFAGQDEDSPPARQPKAEARPAASDDRFVIALEELLRDARKHQANGDVEQTLGVTDRMAKVLDEWRMSLRMGKALDEWQRQAEKLASEHRDTLTKHYRARKRQVEKNTKDASPSKASRDETRGPGPKPRNNHSNETPKPRSNNSNKSPSADGPETFIVPVLPSFEDIKDFRLMLDVFDVSRAAVPFPDTVTIEHPDAEVWRKLAERRIKRHKIERKPDEGSSKNTTPEAVK